MYSDDALLVSSDKHCSFKSSSSFGFLLLFHPKASVLNCSEGSENSGV